ncbi:MAG: DEAD/DEAH box helicase [Vicinamibacterales bacterium]
MALEVQGTDTGNRGHRARFLLPFEPCETLPRDLRPRVVSPRRWQHLARVVLAGAAPAWTSLRSAVAANFTLLPFQLEPAMAYLRGHACRFLIADAVGLGKTVQAGLIIAEMLRRTPDGRALVIAPAGLRDQWRDELNARFGLAAEVLDAGSVARAVARLAPRVNPWAVLPLIITSADYVKRPEVIRSCESLVWDVIAFDEAHSLMGHSDRAAAAAALAARARAVVMLTATPHSGDDKAFERLRGLGNIHGGFPLLTFRRTREALGSVAPSRSSRRRSTLLRVMPTTAEMAVHEALLEYARHVWTEPDNGAGARLAVGVLLRRACSSPASLARSLERRIALLSDTREESTERQFFLPLAGESYGDDTPWRELAAPGMRNREAEIDCLRSLVSLATAAIGGESAGESKLRALRKLLARAAEPAIIFTQYRDTLAHISHSLPAGASVQLHGGMTYGERRDAARAFTHGGARLLLATDAASEGLNLHQRCRLVVSLELPWTPLRLEQRVGRVDRFGQARTVHAIQLVAAGTSEESVVARLTSKAERAEAMVAEAVVNGSSRETNDPPVPALLSSFTSLRSDAEAEAARVRDARVLGAGADARAGAWSSSRPPMTVIRRRHGRGHGTTTAASPQRLWAFRLLFLDRDGEFVWESLVGIRAGSMMSAGHRAPAGTVSAVRRYLDVPPQVSEHLAAAHREHGDRLAGDLRALVALMGARERAIASVLQQRRARLSAAMLQPGLFDRRHERTAEAQSHLLDQAVALTQARLLALDRLRNVRTDTCDLSFAIAIA